MSLIVPKERKMCKDSKDVVERLRKLGLRISKIESELAEAKQEIDALGRMKRHDPESSQEFLNTLIDVLENNDD